jgi:hypothetical protein
MCLCAHLAYIYDDTVPLSIRSKEYFLLLFQLHAVNYLQCVCKRIWYFEPFVAMGGWLDITTN